MRSPSWTRSQTTWQTLWTRLRRLPAPLTTFRHKLWSWIKLKSMLRLSMKKCFQWVRKCSFCRFLRRTFHRKSVFWPINFWIRSTWRAAPLRTVSNRSAVTRTNSAIRRSRTRLSCHQTAQICARSSCRRDLSSIIWSQRIHQTPLQSRTSTRRSDWCRSSRTSTTICFCRGIQLITASASLETNSAIWRILTP